MSYPYGNPGGGFPPQPNYPPQPGFNYPPQPGGFPSQQQPYPGYPNQQGGYYPPGGPPGGYGGQAMPGAQGNFYPPQGGGYPQAGGGGYPPQGGGYPPQGGGGYPPQGGGYPPQTGGYPPQGGGYPPQGGGGYNQGYPPGGNYQTQIPAMNTSSGYPTQGTLRPAQNFSAEEDAKALRKAMKGFGTDEKAIIEILSHRSNSQRQEIKNRFKTMFGKDLMNDLKSELSGNFESAILALMLTPSEYDASQLRGAMKGAGTDESCIVEILCSRSNNEIRQIRSTYSAMYSRDLEKDLMSETSGHFRRLCVSLASGNRVEHGNTNMDKARRDAQELYQAGERMLGTDESKFNEILCSESPDQLRLIFGEYQRIANKDIEKSIKSEMSGDLEKGFVSIVRCVQNLPGFFATKLYNSMKGWGTKDDTLVRIVVSRCEVDMVQIKQEFQRQYGKTLESMIEGDLSGDYKHLIVSLVRGN